MNGTDREREFLEIFSNMNASEETSRCYDLQRPAFYWQGGDDHMQVDCFFFLFFSFFERNIVLSFNY
jgi:hypothetical protein